MINTNRKIILTFLSTFIIILAGGHGIISLPMAFIFFINDSIYTNILNLLFVLLYLAGTISFILSIIIRTNLKKSLFLSGILLHTLSIIIILLQSDAPFISFLTSIPFVLLTRNTYISLSRDFLVNTERQKNIE